jgi:hypothetical protein
MGGRRLLKVMVRFLRLHFLDFQDTLENFPCLENHSFWNLIIYLMIVYGDMLMVHVTMQTCTQRYSKSLNQVQT